MFIGPYKLWTAYDLLSRFLSSILFLILSLLIFILFLIDSYLAWSMTPIDMGYDSYMI